MDTNEGLDLLNHLCKDKDWFCEVGMDEHGRFVVYASTMSVDVLTSVPDKVANRQVLVHFMASKAARREQFVGSNAPSFLPPVEMDTIDVASEVDLGEDYPPDLHSLANELDRLEKICGSHIMQDIFYEVHDGINAVTNLSIKFPDVRSGMEKLYQKYGFDVIYEEMDG